MTNSIPPLFCWSSDLLQVVFLCGDRFHPQFSLCPPAADSEATEVFVFLFMWQSPIPGAQHPGTLWVCQNLWCLCLYGVSRTSSSGKAVEHQWETWKPDKAAATTQQSKTPHTQMCRHLPSIHNVCFLLFLNEGEYKVVSGSASPPPGSEVSGLTPPHPNYHHPPSAAPNSPLQSLPPTLW